MVNGDGLLVFFVLPFNDSYIKKAEQIHSADRRYAAPADVVVGRLAARVGQRRSSALAVQLLIGA